MSMKEARKFQKVIVGDDKLKEQFKGLNSRAAALDKAVEIAKERDFDVTRDELGELMEELSEKTGELDEEALEEVSGGGVSLGWTFICWD